MANEDFVWSEKYRPERVADVVLPSRLKKTFQGYLSKGGIPHLLLSGASGMGKTTVAKALVEELNCEWLLINGSDEGRSIETLRGTMTDFVHVMSMDGKRKTLIIDEADAMLPAIQDALRHFMDRYSKTTSFVLACNNKQRINKHIMSRLTPIDFVQVDGEEGVQIAVQLLRQALMILTKEGVVADKGAVAALIDHYYPDFRKAINMLQKYAAENDNKIDSGILSKLKDMSITALSQIMRSRDFTALCDWTAANRDAAPEVMREIHDQALTLFETKEDAANAAKLIQEHQKWESFCADPEIHLRGTLTYMMSECTWRS